MPLTSYFNFDLVIEEAGELYRARVVDSPVGTASALFEQPLSELELENFILRLGITRQGSRQPYDTLEMQTVKQCGESLFTAVFAGDVYTCFTLSWEHARQQGLGLRIRLQINVPEFHDYPWEYLYNFRAKQFLSLSNDTPVVRYRVLPFPELPLSVKPPLKILVMISSPEGFPPLNVEEEWDKLKNALEPLIKQRLVVLERLKKPTLTELQHALRRNEFHIFHFIGHGKFVARKQDGVILLEEEEDGRGRPVSGQYLGILLHDHQSLRLVVLNACEGARTSRDDPYAGVAQALVQQGIPAVIAMQFAIWEKSAITFAHEFYRSIADGFPVDAAVSEGRKAIFTDGNEVEWGTPVLFMNAPDGMIFDLEQTTRLRPRPEPASPSTETASPAAAKKWFDKLKSGIRQGWLLWSLGIVILLILISAWIDGRYHPAPIGPLGTQSATASPSATPLPPPPTSTPSPTATITPTPSHTPTPTDTPTPTATPYPAQVTDLRGVEMVFVPAGEFMMGFDGSGGPDDERPVHPVFLDAYYIDKYEVSNAQYAECVSWRICPPPVSNASYNMEEKYYGNPKYEAYPVTFVTWEMANNFCTQWRKGRLPTEAEWEKAARGPESRIYPWGEGIKCDLANYRDQNCGRLARPYPVSAFAAGQSVYGAFNMAGNVWEWTSDWYSFSYYSESPLENPQGPLAGLMHVKRGGGFLHTFPFARSSNREQGEPTGYGVDIGFRCVRPVSPTFP